MKCSLSIIILATLSLPATLLLAHSSTGATPAFETLTMEISSHCSFFEETCQSPYALRKIDLNAKDNKELKKQSKRAAADQAGGWGDTILEGDYSADGRLLLGAFYRIYQNGRPVAYYLSYSEGGQYTGGTNCDYDDKAERWHGDGCSSGRIYETLFLSADLKESVIDNPAEFVFDPE